MAACCSRPASRRATAARLPEFVAYVLSPCRRALVRRRLHRDAAGVTRPMRSPTSPRRFGDDPARWRWGEAHPAVFAHPMLRPLPILGAPGDAQHPQPRRRHHDRSRRPAYKQFQSVHGAEYRGVYDLADLDRSLFIVAPGQSGNLLSRHARDFLTRWRDGATITLGPTARRNHGNHPADPMIYRTAPDRRRLADRGRA